MSTTLELQELLDTAVRSIVVRRRGQLATQYSAADYRQALREVRRRYAPDLKLVLGLCDIEITDPSARDTLLNFLRTALQDYIHEDRIQTAIINIYGGLGNGFKIQELAKKLLQLTVALGPGKAAALFMDSLAEPHCPFRNLTLLGGVKIEAPVELYDSVRLILLSEQDAKLPGYLPTVFRQENLMERFRGAALLVEDGLMSPRYMNPKDYLAVADLKGNTPFRTAHKSTDVPDFNSAEFCNALSMVIKARVFPSVSWRFVSEDEIAHLWGTGSGYGWMHDPRPERRIAITEQQIQEAKGVYASLTGMSTDDRTRLAVPIDRLIESWSGKGHIDQIIDLAIALESLYLPEHDTELGYRLRNRGARFLESELPQRQELAAQLKAFYKVRSKAVHTGKTPESHTVGSRRVKTAELIGMTQELCLRSIRQVIDNGLPDWETLELG